jgi:hypothetical protein
MDDILDSHVGGYEDQIWDVMPYSLVDRYQRFRGASCLHLNGTEANHKATFGSLMYGTGEKDSG